jgi:hypothetical protein
MISLKITNGVLHYYDPYEMDSSNVKLVSETLPSSLETYMPKTQTQLKQEHPYLVKTSERNNKQFYILNEESDEVLLNIIPQKKFIDDNSIRYVVNTNFEFFELVTVASELSEPFVLSDGTIFRVTGEGIKPSRDMYTYYIINGGKVQQIPNYKTVEVLLRERNRTSEDIRVIEIGEFEDLMRVTYQNIYIEEGMSPDDAANRAAETIVQLAEQAKTEG